MFTLALEILHSKMHGRPGGSLSILVLCRSRRNLLVHAHQKPAKLIWIMAIKRLPDIRIWSLLFVNWIGLYIRNAYCISKAISIYYFILYVHENDDWNFTLFQNIVFVSAGRQWHCDAQCWLMIQLERRTNFWDDIEHFIYNIIQCSCSCA